MEIVTSWRPFWRQEALEEVANSLREGLSFEAVVRITGLPLEKVQ